MASRLIVPLLLLALSFDALGQEVSAVPVEKARLASIKKEIALRSKTVIESFPIEALTLAGEITYKEDFSLGSAGVSERLDLRVGNSLEEIKKSLREWLLDCGVEKKQLSQLGEEGRLRIDPSPFDESLSVYVIEKDHVQSINVRIDSIKSQFGISLSCSLSPKQNRKVGAKDLRANARKNIVERSKTVMKTFPFDRLTLHQDVWLTEAFSIERLSPKRERIVVLCSDSMGAIRAVLYDWLESIQVGKSKLQELKKADSTLGEETLFGADIPIGMSPYKIDFERLSDKQSIGILLELDFTYSGIEKNAIYRLEIDVRRTEKTL